MSPEQIAYLKTLADPEPHWGGMGALPLPPDNRDYDIRSIPQVADVLAIGVPDTIDFSRFATGPLYNQGAEPSCVAFSTCGLCSLDEVEAGQAWDVFSGHTLYIEAGGDGHNGVDTRRVLEIVCTTGVPGNSGPRKVVGSYAFVPGQPGIFRQSIKAAVAAGQFCTLALLLPAPFQWNSGNAPTSGYHQVIVIGYDPTWAIILNSWGPGWPGDGPHPGIGRVQWDYLEADNLQHGYCYAYTTTPAKLAPPPPPGQLTVTAYAPNPVAAGAALAINGSGFGTVVSASWHGQSLPIHSVAVDTISTQAPGIAQDATDTVTVQSDGQSVTGPALTVSAESLPPPPGSLHVQVIAKRYSVRMIGLWVTARDENGFVAAQVTGTVGNLTVDTHSSAANGVPATWMLTPAQGGLPPYPATISITATTADGRTGMASSTI
jgi:hypothetical protein